MTTSDRLKNANTSRVGVRSGLVQHFDCLTVQVHRFARVVKHLGRPSGRRRLREVSQHALGREDRRHSVRRIRRVLLTAARKAASEQLFSGVREGLIPADVVCVGPGVDDVADRFRRDAFDRGQHGGRGGGGPGVHDDDAILAQLHADVRQVARAGDHEK
jgi:hypothetical protein